jgi:hypothetical protein
MYVHTYVHVYVRMYVMFLLTSRHASLQKRFLMSVRCSIDRRVQVRTVLPRGRPLVRTYVRTYVRPSYVHTDIRTHEPPP